MESTAELARRLREVFLNGKWIANTNCRDLLLEIDHRQAVCKIETLNTVAALTFHLNYYLAGILQVLEGGKLEIRDQYSFDMPEITSREVWENLRNTLFTNAERFAAAVEKLTPETLEKPFADPKYGSWRRNIEGMIEHGYYHLGQIALLRKMILARKGV